MERKTSRLEPFDEPESIQEQETQKLPAATVHGATALEPTDPRPNDSTTPRTSRSPLVIPRRILLIAGGGLVAAGGTLVIAKEAHLASRIRNALLRLYDHAQGQIAARQHGPQPLPDGPMQTPNDVVVFNGALASDWDDWSWADRKIPDKTVKYSGHPVVSMTLGSWSGLQFHHNIFDTTGLGYFQCWVRGVGRGGQDVKVFVVDDLDNWLGDAYLGDFTQGGSIGADTWRLVRVPLQALHAVSVNAQTLIIQSFAGQSQGEIYLADLRFVYHPDLQPAGIERVTSLDLNTVSLRFAQPMDPAMAANVANYLIAAAAGT
ncbi:MAG TPA: hypothetical protein VGP82_14250, partial [Ktedonobacterales bacterium]|nr:hypothetical protein [Ktedonobacterales bacterium]